MHSITILDKKFKIFITQDEIESAVEVIAANLNRDLLGKDVIFIGILNGAFMFFSDILKRIAFNCKVSFIKLMSYDGTSTSGTINELVGLNDEITGKTVVIVEDIIDSGLTIEKIKNQLVKNNPAEIKIAAFLVKPGNFMKNITVEYVGFEIPNDFIVGYGMDYYGYGRNLKNIYTLTD